MNIVISIDEIKDSIEFLNEEIKVSESAGDSIRAGIEIAEKKVLEGILKTHKVPSSPIQKKEIKAAAENHITEKHSPETLKISGYEAVGSHDPKSITMEVNSFVAGALWMQKRIDSTGFGPFTENEVQELKRLVVFNQVVNSSL